MKPRVDRNFVAWTCACLCIIAVGCSIPLGLTGDARTTGDDNGNGLADGGGTGDDGSTGDGGSVDDGTGVQETGVLSVLITDKPYPFEFISEALVTITRVEVHRIGEDDVDTNGAGDVDTNGLGDVDSNGAGDVDTNGVEDGGSNGFGGPWITLFEGEKVFDLLLLQNGKTDLLAEMDVPAGTYNQMRLIVTEGWITLTDDVGSNGEDDVGSNGVGDIGSNGTDDVDTNGRVFSLRVPSGEQTGIKLHFKFEVLADEKTTLLLDVDLSRTFKPVPGGHINNPGDIREFKFQPSLGMRLIELVDAGRISGTVIDVSSNALAAVSVTAFDDGTDTSTSTDDDGAYVLGGLPAGEYRVEFSAAGFDDAEVTGVAVSAGQTTEHVDVVLTPTGQ